MKKYIWRITTGVFLAAWMVLIFCFSAQPAEESSEVSGSVAYRLVRLADRLWEEDFSEQQCLSYAEIIDYPVRKAAHMTEYAILGLLAYAFLWNFQKIRKNSYLLAVMLTALYAATDEIHQLFVPGRAGRFSDVCIDTTGALAGLLLLAVFRFLHRKWRGRARN